jgi:excisionase family DNA binding protein
VRKNEIALAATTNRERREACQRQPVVATDADFFLAKERREPAGHNPVPAGAPDLEHHSDRSHSELPVLVFTLRETAAILKVHEKTVRRLIARELLKATKGIRHLRVTRKSIEEYLAKN